MSEATSTDCNQSAIPMTGHTNVYVHLSAHITNKLLTLILCPFFFISSLFLPFFCTAGKTPF